jgi:hypothetical protein
MTDRALNLTQLANATGNPLSYLKSPDLPLINRKISLRDHQRVIQDRQDRIEKGRHAQPVNADKGL